MKTFLSKLRPSPSSSFRWHELSLNSNSDHSPTYPPISESLFLGKQPARKLVVVSLSLLGLLPSSVKPKPQLA